VGKVTSRLLDLASGALFYPLWSRRDGGVRMAEFHRLEKSQWRDVAADQRNAVLAIARYAHEHCEFYRRRSPVPRTMEDFQRLPVLTKENVRHNGDQLLSNEYARQDLVAAKTGGSTGVALNVFCDQACQQKRNAAALLSDTWSGWKPGERRGALWGNPPVPRGLKARARALLHDRLTFLDTIEMSAANMDRFIDEIRAAGIRTLYGHSHSLFVFANHVAARGAGGLGIRSIISTSMVLLPAERRKIEQVFGCKVNDRYGCEEVSLIASECERHEGLHVNMDHLFVELLRPDGAPAAPGEEGAVVVTELINRGQPLIRYAVGDVAVLSGRPCGCGRPERRRLACGRRVSRGANVDRHSGPGADADRPGPAG
jgi:phenylacetate-CoA ligase